MRIFPPIWPSFPFFIPIPIPDPETLGKYGKAALQGLRGLRGKAEEKGREHRRLLKPKAVFPPGTIIIN
jgi:hypothetical protein